MAKTRSMGGGGPRTRPTKTALIIRTMARRLRLREEFDRVVEELGSVRGLSSSFPSVRTEVRDAIDRTLPGDAEGIFRPRVERRLAPLFRMAGLDLSTRLGTVTFAILHKTWEAQRLFLEALGEELHQAAKTAPLTR